MPEELSESSSSADRDKVMVIRSEAVELLQKLDDSDLVEAAALMASTIDVIESSLRRLRIESSSDPD